MWFFDSSLQQQKQHGYLCIGSLCSFRTNFPAADRIRAQRLRRRQR
jgi:hypothetical protein